MSRFGDALRKLRIDKGMSQEEFATLLGTSKQVISRYEIGQRSPKISIVADYAERLGVPVSYFVSQVEISESLGSESPAAQKLRVIGGELSRASRPSDPRKAEIIAIYDSMNDAGRESLLLAARGFAGSPAMCQDGASNAEKTV